MGKNKSNAPKTEGAKTKKPRKKGSNSPEMQARRNSQFIYRQQMVRELGHSIDEMRQAASVINNRPMVPLKIMEKMKEHNALLESAIKTHEFAKDQTTHVTQQVPNNFDRTVKGAMKSVGFWIRALKKEILSVESNTTNLVYKDFVVSLAKDHPHFLFIPKEIYRTLWKDIHPERVEKEEKQKSAKKKRPYNRNKKVVI